MRLSASSIKKFNGSKSKWAWHYILWVKDEFESDALPLGNLFEHWLLTGEDRYEILEDYPIVDMEQLMTDYDNLKYNSEWLSIELWTVQAEVKWELFGCDFLGYIDNLTDEVVYDIKTSRYLSKKETTTANHWSWMSYYEEYELQLWLYMKLLWRKKAMIAEVAKHRYKDWRKANQIIQFKWTDKWDEDMTKKRQPIVEQMKQLYDNFNEILPLLKKND